MFFLFKQKTADELRISDWSSDVCSSDLFQNHVEHRLPRRHRERIATIGRTMGTEHHAARRLFGREARAEREAAADPLRARHDVGCQAILLMGIEGAGARDADRKSTRLNSSH